MLNDLWQEVPSGLISWLLVLVQSYRSRLSHQPLSLKQPELNLWVITNSQTASEQSRSRICWPRTDPNTELKQRLQTPEGDLLRGGASPVLTCHSVVTMLQVSHRPEPCSDTTGPTELHRYWLWSWTRLRIQEPGCVQTESSFRFHQSGGWRERERRGCWVINGWLVSEQEVKCIDQQDVPTAAVRFSPICPGAGVSAASLWPISGGGRGSKPRPPAQRGGREWEDTLFPLKHSEPEACKAPAAETAPPIVSDHKDS